MPPDARPTLNNMEFRPADFFAAASICFRTTPKARDAMRVLPSRSPMLSRGKHAHCGSRAMSKAVVAVLLLGAVVTIPVDPASALEFKLPNELPSGQFGFAVAALPDMNGDGRGDVVIGSRGAPSPCPAFSGHAFILDGATGELLRTFKSPNEEVGGLFGIALAAIMDTNGDGVVDIAIGAPHEDPGASPNNAGRVYLFDGATGSLLRTYLSPNEVSNGIFGDAVTVIPDMNGDGKGDFMVGAQGEDIGASSSAGRAYIFSGADNTLIRTLATPNPQFIGAFGKSVAGVPDTDGDGILDYLVGARGEGGGRAYVFSGSDGSLLRTLSSPGGGGKFGNAVAGLGDIDGDGLGDLAVGAPEEFADPGGGINGGRVYLFSGASGVLVHTLYSPSQPTPDSRWFGYTMARLSDIDGDGSDDLAVGAVIENTAGGPDEGAVHLFSGNLGAHLRRLVSPNNQPGGQVGWSLSGLPDVNGDQKDDLIIGAPTEDPGDSPSDAGRAYTFDPRTGTSIPIPGPPTLQQVLNYLVGITSNPNRLDINGDGVVDIADVVARAKQGE